jgi:predicted adenylyl cyclase CyaB
MPYLNIEIKARCADPAPVRQYLQSSPKADFRGTDEQTDTYFRVSNGRLKLREGRIENNLIYYERADQPGPRSSSFELISIGNNLALKEVLTNACGIMAIIKKRREIFYIGNVKFHIDNVEGLGSFIEIEAGNITADYPADQLRQQCEFYMSEFNLRSEDLVDMSYSDMILAHP